MSPPTTDAPTETTTPNTSIAFYGVDTSGPGFFSTWFDGALLALTLVTVTAHLYVVGVAIRCSPKEMRDYRSVSDSFNIFNLVFRHIYFYFF
jgi:hypothetical protein